MSPTITRAVSANPKAASLARLAKVLANGRSDRERRELADGQRDVPQVGRAFELEHTKTAVPAGNTGSTPWAGALMAVGIWPEALEVSRDLCAFDALAPRMRRTGFKTPTPRESTARAVGGVVAEGAAAPVVPWAFDSVNIGYQKVVTASVLSRELARLDPSPQTDVLVRDILLRGNAQSVDAAFLDPAKATSITNGVTPVNCSGSSAAQMTTDFAALIAAVTTPGTSLVWLLPRQTAARVALALGASAAGLPGTLFGLPAICTASLPAQVGSPSGQLVALVDAAEIVVADDGYELGLGDQATIEMSDAPTSEGTTPTGTTSVSMWQANLVAFLQTRYVNWSARSGAVAWMSASY